MPAALRTLLCLSALVWGACVSPPRVAEHIPARLIPWSNALTAEQWHAALDDRFAPHGAGQGYFTITPTALLVMNSKDDVVPAFALATRPPGSSPPALAPGVRYWHTRRELGRTTPEHPLAGLRIALDPGHLGGVWGPLEARSFSVDGRPPVQEGDLALRVAQLLAPRLEALGAQVQFVRDQPGPLSGEKIDNVHPANSAELRTFLGDDIRRRARKVNEELQPDLVLCLHFDATDWPDPQHPALVDAQHYHILVNGAYLPGEIANPEQRVALLERIADGAGEEELAVARAMAEASAPIFLLPAYGYGGANGIALGGKGYVWGRNLEANRIYRCPVVFMEPYVANSVEGYERIQAGEYEGTRDFGGVTRKNIFKEYVDAVVAGLVNYYGQRPAAPLAAPR